MADIVPSSAQAAADKKLDAAQAKVSTTYEAWKAARTISGSFTDINTPEAQRAIYATTQAYEEYAAASKEYRITKASSGDTTAQSSTDPAPGASPSSAPASNAPPPPPASTAVTLDTGEQKLSAQEQDNIKNTPGTAQAIKQYSAEQNSATVDNSGAIGPTNSTTSTPGNQSTAVKTEPAEGSIHPAAAVKQPTTPTEKSSQPTSSSPSSTVAKQTSVVPSYGRPTFVEQPNILHDYASYTYNLALHFLTPNDYNAMMANPETYHPNKILIASGGRRDATTAKRDQHFDEDFFFEKLEFNSSCTSSGIQTASNGLDMKFTIIEPYGMTLINRIMSLAASDAATKDEPSKHKKKSIAPAGSPANPDVNVQALPYLLEISFYGSKDDGVPEKIPEITKWLPISLLAMKIKVSTKGTEYACEAAPYSHSAFQQTIGSTPFKMEGVANSVGDFFSNNLKGAALQAKDETKAVTDAKKAEDDQAKAQAEAERKAAENKDKKADPTRKLATDTPAATKVKSYPGALNAWNRQHVTDNNAEDPPVIYQFEIDDDIAKATFPGKDIINKENRSYSKDTDRNSQTGIKTGMDNRDNPSHQLSFDAGTPITEVIDTVIKNSTYFYDQLLDPESGDVTQAKIKKWMDKPLEWYTVTPRVTIKETVDKKLNIYTKVITYKITKFFKYNAVDENAPQGGPIGAAKDYQYIFTGKNSDILNWELNFDMLYNIVKVANPANISQDNQAANKPQTQDAQTDNDNKVLTKEEATAYINTKKFGRPEFHPKRTLVATTPGYIGNNDTKAEIGKQVSKNLFTKTDGADQIQVILKIIGDPDWIKQDDSFFPTPMNYTPPSDNISPRTPNNSIRTDLSEVPIRLTFKTPIDYDDDTGVADPNGGGVYSEGSFSGLYTVIAIKSSFANGKFEQELTTTRYANQPTPGDDTLSTSSTEDVDRGPNAGAGAGAGAEPQVRTDKLDPSSSTGPSLRTPLSVDGGANSNIPTEKLDIQDGPKTLDTNISSASLSQYGASGNHYTPGMPGAPIDVDAMNGTISGLSATGRGAAGTLTNSAATLAGPLMGGSLGTGAAGLGQKITNTVASAASLPNKLVQSLTNAPSSLISNTPVGTVAASDVNNPISKYYDSVSKTVAWTGSKNLTANEFALLSPKDQIAYQWAGGAKPTA